MQTQFPSLIELLEARIAPATFLVTNLLDDLSGHTLRDAVNAANADPATADTITFAHGLTGTIVLDPAKNAIDITGSVTIKGPGIDKLTVSGDETTRAFFIDDNNAAKLSPVSIQNLSIRGGAGGTNGGVIHSLEPLALTNVVVANGTCNAAGGGVYVDTAGKVSITGCQIVNNQVVNMASSVGGGLWLSAAGGIVISKSVITNNASAVGVGGGAELLGSGTKTVITVKDTLFSNNASNDSVQGDGAGLFVELSPGGSSLVKNCTFIGNAAGDEAGAIYFAAGKHTVLNSSFTANVAAKGGAFFMNGAADVTISKSVFAENDASDSASPGGGAIDSADGKLSITGSQFIHNRSEAFGGALSVQNTTPGNLKVASSLFAGNTARYDGGAVFLTGPVTALLKSDTFTGNEVAQDGGALRADSKAVVTISGGSFLDNRAGLFGVAGSPTGGAVAIGGTGADGASLHVMGTLFQGNSSADGGAVALDGSSTANFKAARFLANETDGSFGGGAIYATTTGTVDILSSFFRGNVAPGEGGGVHIENGFVAVTSSSFFENVSNFGGAIDVKSGTVALAKLTVMRNIASGSGGGIFVDASGTATLDAASKLSGNFAPVGANRDGF